MRSSPLKWLILAPPGIQPQSQLLMYIIKKYCTLNIFYTDRHLEKNELMMKKLMRTNTCTNLLKKYKTYLHEKNDADQHLDKFVEKIQNVLNLEII